MTAALIIVSTVVGLALWFSRAKAEDKKFESAVEALKGVSTNVSISNVEAIEERRVFVFVPSIDGSVVQNVPRAAGGMMARNPSELILMDPLLIGQSPDRWLKSVSMVDLLSGKSMPLVRGAYYSQIPRMGDLPFASLRMRVEWAERVVTFRGGRTVDNYVVDFDITGTVWASWWRAEIVTVGSQVKAGGVFEVEPIFL